MSDENLKLEYGKKYSIDDLTKSGLEKAGNPLGESSEDTLFPFSDGTQVYLMNKGRDGSYRLVDIANPPKDAIVDMPTNDLWYLEALSAMPVDYSCPIESLLYHARHGTGRKEGENRRF